MDPRNVPLRDGDVLWLFPTASDAERNTIEGILLEADDTLYRSGQAFGAGPDERIAGIPLNRLYYQRLGPLPDFSATVLVAEGGSEPILTDLVCVPRDAENPDRGGPVLRTGPPWRIDARVSLRCDVDSRSCPGHGVMTWPGVLVGSHTATAESVLAAARWVLRIAVQEDLDSLRARDPQRGHPPNEISRD